MKMRLPIFALVCLAGLAAAAGCGRTVNHKIDDRIRAELPRLLGPAQKYVVNTSADSLVALNGKIHSIDVVGTEVMLSSGLYVDQVHLHAEDVVLDTHSGQVKHAGLATFSAQLGQGTLDQDIGSENGRSDERPKDFYVKIAEDDLVATFSVLRAGIEVPVTIHGTLGPDPNNPGRLDFIPLSGKLGLLPVPDSLIGYTMDSVNPVVTLLRLRVPLQVTSVTVANGNIIISGTASVASALSRSGA